MNKFVFLFIPFLFSCNTMKKRCEKTNWHMHGKNIAMQGKWLNEDNFVKQCEKAEAHVDYSALDLGFKSGRSNYCEPDVVFGIGREGKPFNPTLCDGSPIDLLKQKHQEGVKIFCQPDNGYRVAAKGFVYNNICPPDLEKPFMAKYQEGRKVYLEGMISEKESEIKVLEQERVMVNNQIRTLNRNLNILPPTRRLNSKEKVKLTLHEVEIEKKRKKLSREIKRKERRISNIFRETKNLKKQIATFKRELRSIK